jgi:hypothetical protein
MADKKSDTYATSAKVAATRVYPGCYFLYANGATYRARRNGRRSSDKWMLFRGEREVSGELIADDLVSLRECKEKTCAL